MMAQIKIQLLAVVLAICISVGYARAPKKIISGQEASIQELPHQVSLQTPDGFHFCGGTIIDATHILTAAHCLVDEKFKSHHKRIDVVTGTADKMYRSSNNVFYVKRSILHSDYNPDVSYANDIAILELDGRILFNNLQKPAKLPTRDTPGFSSVISSGWGATSYNRKTESGGDYPRYLKKLTRTVVPLDKCQKIMHDSHITHGQICVWSPRGADSCTGDSGGPLTWNGEVIGITSWGIGCGLDEPDIYTRVYHYLPWITKVLAE